jgi:7-cyano-7-deazaguanine synthase
MQKKAVILFSGGLDSTTCVAIAQSQGFSSYALSFSYDQKHRFELDAAKRIAKQMGVMTHKIVSLSLGEIAGSALTDQSIEVPDYANSDEIPVTYVPARNTIFLSIALGWAEVIGAFDIFIGANVLDYSGYPDCRPEYLTAYETLANLATKASVEGKARFKIHAPLLQWSKAEIIQAGMKLGVSYGLTVSCYRLNEEGEACGKCDSCVYRKKGFQEAGVADPTLYS